MNPGIQSATEIEQDAGCDARGDVRICILANAALPHTVRWANYFALQGYGVHVLSFEPGTSLSKDVQLHSLSPNVHRNLRYFLAARHVRKLIHQIQPDILHAHYASGYGTLGRLARFRPYVLSVWGMDVFEFPETSALHRRLLEVNLASADYICSTSHMMARRTSKYCGKPITVTPFGVDCSQFVPMQSLSVDSGEFVVGTVKALEPKYGIEFLIRGFSLFSERCAGRRVRLIIAGHGSLTESLKKLTRELRIDRLTDFVGAIPHQKVPEMLSRFSVFAALSVMDSESFGVAVVEASACELPVVVTSVGGFPEVVADGITGIFVPPGDPEAAAAAFSTLMGDADMRRKLGAAGRKFVLENYEWSENAGRMKQLYESILASN